MRDQTCPPLPLAVSGDAASRGGLPRGGAGGVSSLSRPAPWQPFWPTAEAAGRPRPLASPRWPAGADGRPGGLLPARDAALGPLGAFLGMPALVSSPVSPPRAASTASRHGDRNPGHRPSDAPLPGPHYAGDETATTSRTTLGRACSTRDSQQVLSHVCAGGRPCAKVSERGGGW